MLPSYLGGPDNVRLGSKLYVPVRLTGEPKISSSVIEAQLLALLPLTVIRTYRASVFVNVYFSWFSVVPLLEPLNLFVNVVPSVEVAITKL